MPKSDADQSILEMALVGYEAELQTIDEKMSEIRRLLNGGVKHSYIKRSAVEGAAPVRKRRKMGAAARKRIGDAARKRWAELRKAKAGKKG
jgi:hypothetical protein